MPSHVYGKCPFGLKFSLNLWGSCFVSDPMALHVSQGRGPAPPDMPVPSGCGNPCSPLGHFGLFGPTIPHYSAIMSFHRILLPLPIYSDLFISGFKNFFFCELCTHHCFNLPLKAGPFRPSILSFTLLRIPFLLMRCPKLNSVQLPFHPGSMDWNKQFPVL